MTPDAPARAVRRQATLDRLAVALYRYGVALFVGLEAANYTAWGLNMLDWRCIVAALAGAVVVLVITAPASRSARG